MKVTYIKDFKTFKEKDLTLALGFFDGMHLGHKQVLNKAIEYAKKSNTKSAIFTFNMSVKDYISKSKIELLTTTDEKIEIAKNIGFDMIYFIELTDEFINLTRDEFIDLFLKDMRYIITGFDYKFGKNQEGDINYLKSKFGDKLVVVDKIEFDGIKIGTYVIKEELKNGNLSLANKLLDRPYMLIGYIHKVNKYYSISCMNKFIPRNGYYYLTLIIDDEKIDFISKIKRRDLTENLTLKPIDDFKLELKMKKHNYVKLIFNDVYQR